MTNQEVSQDSPEEKKVDSSETEEVEEVQTKDDAEQINGETKKVAEEEKAQKEQEDFEDKYYYLAAEMQNLQRRFDRERDSILKFGNERLLKDLIEVVDNFERTLGFIKDEEDEKVKNIATGVDMVGKQFLDILGKHGLKKIEAMGEAFDPNLHEALAQQKMEGKKEMEIIHVHQEGYTLNDRVIRASKVIFVNNEE